MVIESSYCESIGKLRDLEDKVTDVSESCSACDAAAAIINSQPCRRDDIDAAQLVSHYPNPAYQSFKANPEM